MMSEEEPAACASVSQSKTDELIGLMTEMMKMMKEDRERARQPSRFQRRGRGGFNRGQRGGGQRDLQCWTCNEYGHTSRECQNSRQVGARGKSGGCWTCGKPGHLSRDCPDSPNQGN